MAKARGIIKEIASKKGLTVSEVKSMIMKTIIEVASKLAATQGLPWKRALSEAARTVWSLIREKHDIPTVDEVLARLTVRV